MSNLKDIAQHSTELCVASAALASGAATGLGAFAVPAAALAGIGAALWSSCPDRTCKRAVTEILREMNGRPGFDDATLKRAADILKDKDTAFDISPKDLSKAAKTGNFTEETVKLLLSKLPFKEEPLTEKKIVSGRGPFATHYCRTFVSFELSLAVAV